MIISPFRVKKFHEQRHEPKKNWRGKELCWGCGRLIPVYTHKEINVLGEVVEEVRFRRHISPRLKLFRTGGIFSGDIQCIKSNTFAR